MEAVHDTQGHHVTKTAKVEKSSHFTTCTMTDWYQSQ